MNEQDEPTLLPEGAPLGDVEPGGIGGRPGAPETADAIETADAPEPAPAAARRHFELWRDGRLALRVRDGAGPMVSTSAPPPLPGRGPVLHPFATATAYVAEWEGQLGSLLRAAPSLDAYLEEAAALGYEVRPTEG